MDEPSGPVPGSDDCRRVIELFLRSDAETLSLHDISTAVVSDSERHERGRRHLHHCVLPKLAEAGIVEYDWSSHVVRLRLDRAELRNGTEAVHGHADVPPGLRN